MNLNTVTFGGTCARSPVAQPYGSEGKQLAVFVIVNHGGKRPVYVECIAFGKECDDALAYIIKGDTVVVEGSLSQETWREPKSGEPRERTKIIVRKLFLKQG